MQINESINNKYYYKIGNIGKHIPILLYYIQ